MRRWLVAWAPAATWAAVLFFASSRPTLPVDLSSGLDKLAHFSAYLVLGFFAAHAVEHLKLPILFALVVASGYGLLDELHQSAVPGRDASIGDWLADTAGAVAGILLYRYLLEKTARGRISPEPEPVEP